MGETACAPAEIDLCRGAGSVEGVVDYSPGVLAGFKITDVAI